MHEQLAEQAELLLTQKRLPFGFDIFDGLAHGAERCAPVFGEPHPFGAVVVGIVGGLEVSLANATPGVFGPAYFRELSEVLAAATGGPPDQGRVVEEMRRHGLTPARSAA